MTRTVVGIMLGALAVAGCAAAQTIQLRPGAERIEVVRGEVDRSRYQFIGEVQGTARATDIAVATENARNDLRNQAARMGATMIVLDTSTTGNAMDWSGRNQVVLTGRAFAAAGGAQPPDARLREVEIRTDEVDRDRYEFLGEVRGSARSSNLAEATTEARALMAAEASALGADVIVIDTQTAGNANDWTGRNQVVLFGRAYARRSSRPQAEGSSGLPR